MARVVFLSLTVFALLAAVGCPKSTEPASVETSELPESLPKVTAYINVTTGCQKSTIDLLGEAQQQYSGVIDIEIVDFGDAGDGARRWQESGLGCMAIVFGEDHMVAWDDNGKVKVVDFKMPPGFNWKLEELKEALAQFAAGSLRAPTAEEAPKVQKLEPKAIEAKAQAVKQDDGSEAGQLIIGEAAVLTITQPAGDLTPVQRAEAAARAIEEWTSGAYKPEEMNVEKSGEDLQILGGDTLLLTVTEGDAKAAVMPLAELAGKWRNRVRCNIVAINTGSKAVCND